MHLHSYSFRHFHDSLAYYLDLSLVKNEYFMFNWLFYNIAPILSVITKFLATCYVVYKTNTSYKTLIMSRDHRIRFRDFIGNGASWRRFQITTSNGL